MSSTFVNGTSLINLWLDRVLNEQSDFVLYAESG